MGWRGSTHLPAYSIMAGAKASDKTIMCYQTGASWEVSCCRPKYLTRTTTERFPTQEGIGVRWNLSVPLAVRMMDIRCDAQKTPTRIWTRTYTWRRWEKAGPRGFAGPGVSWKSRAGFMRGCKLAPALLCATGREILQRFGGVAAFVPPWSPKHVYKPLGCVWHV